MSLSDTQRAILIAAAQHADHLAYPPARLPTGARQSVAKALLRQALVVVTDRPVDDPSALWTLDGRTVLLEMTEQALGALTPDIARERASPASAPTMPDAAAGAATAARQAGDAVSLRNSVRKAATALLAAWDACPAQDITDNPITRAVEALRGALEPRQSRPTREPGTPRQGAKQKAVLSLLRRPEGATIAQVMEVTGWQQLTVRGFLAGLKKRQGISVAVLGRVRQVEPRAQGSRGSHSVYAVAE